jgi:hypothetical protein
LPLELGDQRNDDALDVYQHWQALHGDRARITATELDRAGLRRASHRRENGTPAVVSPDRCWPVRVPVAFAEQRPDPTSQRAYSPVSSRSEACSSTRPARTACLRLRTHSSSRRSSMHSRSGPITASETV